jgi:DNA-binding HxlR family transcriptional regulator
MSIAQSVADVLEDYVVLEVEGIDRVYLNVYVPQLQCEYGVVQFFRVHRQHPWASSALCGRTGAVRQGGRDTGGAVPQGATQRRLRLLPHPFQAADRKAGYRCAISILQAEFSLTQVLDRPVHGRMFFEEVIRENVHLGRPDEVQFLFDRKMIRTTPGRFRTRIVMQGVTPSLNVYYKNTRIEQYHKEGRAPRTETTINNTWDFRVGKRLHTLPKLRHVGFQANRRLLEAERISHDCMRAEEAFQKINRPVEVNHQRAAALRFADPRVHALWHALVLLRLLPNGFRNTHLRQHLADLSGRRSEDIRQGAMTCRLRRLRLHGMIERVPQTHRYRVTESGVRTALFFTRSYTGILRPSISGARRKGTRCGVRRGEGWSFSGRARSGGIGIGHIKRGARTARPARVSRSVAPGMPSTAARFPFWSKSRRR